MVISCECNFLGDSLVHSESFRSLIVVGPLRLKVFDWSLDLNLRLFHAVYPHEESNDDDDSAAEELDSAQTLTKDEDVRDERVYDCKVAYHADDTGLLNLESNAHANQCDAVTEAA